MDSGGACFISNFGSIIPAVVDCCCVIGTPAAINPMPLPPLLLLVLAFSDVSIRPFSLVVGQHNVIGQQVDNSSVDSSPPNCSSSDCGGAVPSRHPAARSRCLRFLNQLDTCVCVNVVLSANSFFSFGDGYGLRRYDSRRMARERSRKQ